jgi:hypothetical protein
MTTTYSYITVADPSQGANGYTGSLSINDSGQVVGFYYNGTNEEGFIATPMQRSPANSPPGLDHVVALFNQSIAAGFSDQQQHGVVNTNPLSQGVANQEQFLAHPHHG